MPKLVTYKENFKDDIFRLITTGEIVMKDESYDFLTESKIPFRVKKGDFAYIASNENKKQADGVLVHDKDGKIVLLVASKENIEATIEFLIKNLEEKNLSKSLKSLEGLANPNEILVLNKLGFQTVKYVLKPNNQNCVFLVRKELDCVKAKKNKE